jgi:hypothetical protein
MRGLTVAAGVACGLDRRCGVRAFAFALGSALVVVCTPPWPVAALESSLWSPLGVVGADGPGETGRLSGEYHFPSHANHHPTPCEVSLMESSPPVAPMDHLRSFFW